MSTQSSSESSSNQTARITYAELILFHHERNKISTRGKNKGKPRSQKVIENDNTALKQWRESLQPPKSENDLIGHEFGKDFQEKLEKHLEALRNKTKSESKKKGGEKQPVIDRRSQLSRWQESYRAMLETPHLPSDFNEALKILVDEYLDKHKDQSLYSIAKQCRIHGDTLSSWVNRGEVPAYRALVKVQSLERFFNLSAGVLVFKLRHVFGRNRDNVKSQTTPERAQLASNVLTRYALQILPPSVQSEWLRLVRFFTDLAWVISKQLKRGKNSEWRTRKSDGVNVTEIYKNTLARRYLGFLCLDLPDEDESASDRGRRFKSEELSIALLSVAPLVYAYINWKRKRNRKQAYNSETKSFLQFCSQLVHPRTGYLTQHPEFGLKLPKKIKTKSAWLKWCEENHSIFNRYLKELKFEKTRDPFDPIEEYLDLRHPLDIVEDLADALEASLPPKKSNPVKRAFHFRNVFLVRFMNVIPFREFNFSIMTYRLMDNGKPHKSSNLYQKENGSWHIRFEPWQFKNERGAAKDDPYDVELTRSLWPYIEEYLNVHRPILFRALVETVSPPTRLGKLTDEQILELMNERCHQVFLPHPKVINNIKPISKKGFSEFKDKVKERIAKATIEEREGWVKIADINIRRMVKDIQRARSYDFYMSEGAMGELVFKMTQLYISGCVGFSPHSWRHIVATEFVKNNPHGYAIAAAVLHITEEMVRSTYARFVTSDKLEIWNRYYEAQKERRSKELRGAAV